MYTGYTFAVWEDDRLVPFPSACSVLDDSSVRRWVESGLRDGKLKAFVCTSSLDLGVDFTAVDLVVQIGSPKGAARLLLEEVRTTAPYASLSDAEWAWVIDFVIRGGTLEAYPEIRRVEQTRDRYVVTVRRTITRHRFAIGTIVSDAAMRVKFLRGATLGTAEESSLAKVKPGERFPFAGRVVPMPKTE